MHLFVKLFLKDLESVRNELVDLFEKLTPQEWKRKIPSGEKDIRDLGEHILSDAKRLSILAPIVGIHDVFPKPSTEDRYFCIWDSQKRPLSTDNILAKSKYERNKLRTILSLARDKKQAKQLYESNFQTGWHERMHIFDLQQALKEENQIIIEQATNLDIAFLYDIDISKLDDIAQTNQTYRQEIKILSQGKFVNSLHRWLSISDHISRLKGSADLLQQIHHIHNLRNDVVEHINSLDNTKLEVMIDRKPLRKRVQKIVLDFQTKMLLLKKINLRDCWARKSDL